MIETIIATLIAMIHAQDVRTMCGPEPKDECLTWMAQCMDAGTAMSIPYDALLENCSESIPWRYFPK